MKNKKKPGTNEFYDINTLPTSQGITVLGVSMPLIGNRQSATKCFEATKLIITKIKKSGVGAVVVYSDGLYMNSKEPAQKLKSKFQNLMEQHKQRYQKLIEKDKTVIDQAFTFTTWSQLILSCQNFTKYLEKLKKIYEKDKQLQKCVKKDIKSNGKKTNQYTINYMLEEVLLDYLVSMGKVRLQNDFTQDRERWILHFYHGKPHRASVLIYQKNYFGLKSENPYQGSFYDLKNKRLYDFDRLDIETFDFNS